MALKIIYGIVSFPGNGKIKIETTASGTCPNTIAETATALSL